MHSMALTLTRLLVHLIFSTKDRIPLIPCELEPDLYSYLGGICRDCDSPLLVAGGMPDHVHLLVSLSKNRALSDLLMEVKRGSSKWMKTQGSALREFAWQDGYAGFSIGESGVPAVTAYIQNQKEHHRTRTFKEELVEFLVKYGVEYDERYIWS